MALPLIGVYRECELRRGLVDFKRLDVTVAVDLPRVSAPRVRA